ncbi:MAG: PD-(D/E)XK nuclease family protein, partial [Acidobacteriota bacterium]
DGPALDDGWLQPLDNALYPPPERARDAHPAPGCPSFRGTASVLQRPMRFDGRDETSVRPGLHRPQTGAVPVAWWDPSLLVAQGDESDGQRAARQARDPQRERLLVPDGDDGRDGPVAQATADAHAAWQSAEARARRMGAQPSQRVATVTERARALRPPGADDDAAWVEETLVPRIEIDVPPRADERPSGVRFGTLVHTVLRDVPLAGDGDADEDDGDPGTIAALASLHGRLLACPAAEIDAAATAVRAALAHPLLQRARRAAICHRELPVLVRDADGAQIEGTIDLAFRDAVDGPWTVVDFKTDRALDAETAAAYRLQVAWYLVALRRVDDETGRPGEEDRGVLLGV